jgi:DNA transposition AAA+ family ATPase
MSQTEAARIIGVDKSLVSRVVSHEYKGWEQKEKELIHTLSMEGVQIEFDQIKRYGVDQTKFITTENVRNFDELAMDLLENPNLTSSIGVAKGTAGRGKTASAKHFVSTHSDAIYVLYVDGYSHTMLAREIAYELTGVRARSFADNIDLINSATNRFRRLVIIDEADKMPGKHIEMLRSLNERCSIPLLLVGEETLYQRMAEEPRRLSRIRKPIVNFTRVTKVDIALFYESAVGIQISSDKDVLSELLDRSHGDFRMVVSDAMSVCRVLNASGMHTVSMEVVNRI